jgi:hypothetical protein
MDTEKLVSCRRRPDPWASEHFQSDLERLKERSIRNNLARRGVTTLSLNNSGAIAPRLSNNDPCTSNRGRLI